MAPRLDLVWLLLSTNAIQTAEELMDQASEDQKADAVIRCDEKLAATCTGSPG